MDAAGSEYVFQRGLFIKQIFTIAVALTMTVLGLYSAGKAAQDSTDQAADLISMARSGVDETVLQTYIETSPMPYDLSADDIVTLKDLGVSSKVIRAALLHGRAMDTATARETVKGATEDAGSADMALATSSAVAPPSDSLNVSFFYQSLYPYGNWVDVDGVWCWQPNAAVMSTDWAPYCNRGHWVYTDWGWCWASDYSWGWAPFHYGRWLRHRQYGWCWVPDTQWGPAWVSWRRGDDYCGWAPLPPGAQYVDGQGFYFGGSLAGDDNEFNLTPDDYCFVPADHFSDSRPWGHTVPAVRVAQVYRNTTFVKNGYGSERGHVVNRGLPVDFVASATGKKVVTVAVAPQNPAPSQPIQRAMVKDGRLTIYKPALSSRMPETPAVIKARFEKTPQIIVSRNSIAKRQQEAAVQTINNQETEAHTAKLEETNLESAAKLEADSRKRADMQAEAGVREMRVQQAQAHVAQIKKWSPPSAPVMVPKSKVVQQQSPVNREQVRTQAKTMIQQEAREEQQRQKSMEEMVRKPLVAQSRVAPARLEQKNNAGLRKTEANPVGAGSKR